MQPPLTELSDAVTELKRLAQADVYPTLSYASSTDEIQTILGRAKRGSVWASSTNYNFGDVVIPSANKRNGHRYRIVKLDGSGRSSSSSEPSWPTSREGTVVDGNITWQEDGWDYDAVLFDMRQAAYEAWGLKESKASSDIDFTSQATTFKQSDVVKNCRQKKLEYAPVLVI